MKIVVGLGNPGRDYAATRHNIGFLVVDELARRFAASEPRKRFRSLIAETFDQNEKIVLVKPQTYMNLSGIAVRETLDWYKAPLDDLLIVADDIDLPFGALRMRPDGRSGGHNGLKSIFEELGTHNVPRFRIGIGRGPGNATRRVLSRFSPDEQQALPELIQSAADCVVEWERQGIITTMNRCNRRPESISGPAAPSAAESDPTQRTIS